MDPTDMGSIATGDEEGEEEADVGDYLGNPLSLLASISLQQDTESEPAPQDDFQAWLASAQRYYGTGAVLSRLKPSLSAALTSNVFPLLHRALPPSLRHRSHERPRRTWSAHRGGSGSSRQPVSSSSSSDKAWVKTDFDHQLLRYSYFDKLRPFLCMCSTSSIAAFPHQWALMLQFTRRATHALGAHSQLPSRHFTVPHHRTQCRGSHV